MRLLFLLITARLFAAATPGIPWEDSWYFHTVMNQYERGRELPGLLRRVSGQVSELMRIERSSTPSPLEDLCFSETIPLYAQVVGRISATCSTIAEIIGSCSDLEAVDARGTLGTFAKSRISSSQHYPDFIDLVRDILHTHVVSNHGVKIPTLIIQALALIQRYVFMEPSPSPSVAAWYLDMSYGGIQVPFDDFIPQPDRLPYTRVQMLRRFKLHVLTTVHASLQGGSRQVPGLESRYFVRFIAEELHRYNNGIVETDEEFRMQLKQLIAESHWALLTYFRLSPLDHIRSSVKLLADLNEAMLPLVPLQDRMAMVLDFLKIPLTSRQRRRIPPLIIRVSGRDSPEDFVKSSTTQLLGYIGVHAFIHDDFIVEYSDTGSVGDGVRRDWLTKMAKHYFAPGDESAWEFTSDMRLSIRPKQFIDLPEDSQGVHRMRILVSGALIAISIRYGISLGTVLGPSVLVHLKDSEKEIDLEAVCAAEDPAFVQGLEKLHLLDWDDPQAIALVLPSPTMEIGGRQVVISPDNLDTYIRRQKYQKVVWSISQEMQLLRVGMNAILMPGTLHALTREELSHLISGTRELDAEMILRSLDFPQGEKIAESKQWLIEIISEMSRSHLRQLVVFATGSPHPPALPTDSKWLNFQLTTAPIPVKMRAGIDPRTLTLPYSRTCFGAIFAPAYPSKAVFRDKLYLAISEAQTLENE